MNIEEVYSLRPLVHSAASHPRCPEGGGVTSGAVRWLFNRVLLARIIGLLLPPKQETEGGGARRSPPDPGVLQELTASRDFPCFVQVRPPFSPTKGKKKHPLVLREAVANRRHIVLARAGCATYSTFAGLGTPAELHRREDFRGGWFLASALHPGPVPLGFGPVM